MYETELYYRANFHADVSEITVSGQKIHIFLHRGLPCGLATVPCYTFLESSRRANVMPCSAATYRFRDIRNRNFGFGATWGTPKGRRPVVDPYMPSSEISLRSVAPPPRYPSPHKNTRNHLKLII